MKKVFLLGRSGFVGQAFSRFLQQHDGDAIEVVPLTHPLLEDEYSLRQALRETQPDWIVHLAAVSSVQQSFRDVRGTLEVNLLGTLNLLNAILAEGFAGRLLYVSSGDVYGSVPIEELPITEARLPRPLSPYSVSKLAAEFLCYQFGQANNLDVVIVRPFNHIGAEQSRRFIIPDLAGQIAEIKLGRHLPQLMVGNIDVTRDFLDVDDVVRAYLALLEHGRTGVTYNVCSGKEHKIRDLLEKFRELAGLDALPVTIDPTRLRPAEQIRMRGCYDLLKKDTGWEPSIPLNDTLQKILKFQLNSIIQNSNESLTK